MVENQTETSETSSAVKVLQLKLMVPIHSSSVFSRMVAGTSRLCGVQSARRLVHDPVFMVLWRSLGFLRLVIGGTEL